MNFFAAQDQARRASRRLVIAYILATVLIVAGVTAIVGFAQFSFSDSGYGYTAGQFAEANSGVLLGVALLTTLFILGASMFKTAVLSSGGGAVASQMGGTLVPADVQEPLRRRLRNVVEEMAIASGVPVPEIYVLEEESSINAFAAGFSPSDAAIAVTRGTLELLDRNELQGVTALHILVMMGLLCLSVTFLTEITSNTATTAILMPVLMSAAQAMNIDPTIIMIPAAISASCALTSVPFASHDLNFDTTWFLF